MSESSIPSRADRWGICAEDYERFRLGALPGYYNILAGLGRGLPGQNLLDLGTGHQLDRHLADHRAHPEDTSPWDEVKASALARLRARAEQTPTLH